MYDTLLFLHVLGAFVSFVTIGVFSAFALGVAPDKGSFALGDWTWNVSGAMLLVFGVWLALYVDGYSLLDGWILGALVLFGAASVFGGIAHQRVRARIAPDAEPTAQQVSMWHWLRTISLIGILVMMVWKPGA